MHPSSKQEEDADMERAIAMSRGELGTTYQQESGIIGSGGQDTQYGPHPKDHYKPSEWALVPFKGPESSEIVPDVDVELRVHTAGEPRLLKHLPIGDYMSNFLTICHAINGAKEALLMRSRVQRDYGQDGEWWRGHPISLPRIVHVEDGSPAEPESDKYDELIAEVQRLMAFLSASSRSYGNVGALTQTDAIKSLSPSSTRSGTLLELFIQNWVVGAISKLDGTSDVTSLFTTTVGTNANESKDTRDMSLINIQVSKGEGAKSDLAELLDGLLWDTDADDTTMSDNHIERPADVLVMRVYQSNASVAPQLGVEVPAEFYVDKYLAENMESTRAIRLEMANGRKRITKIDDIEKKLKSWQHPKKNEQLDAQMLLKHTHGHFSGANRIAAAKVDKTNNAPVTDEVDANPPHYQTIAEKLERVIESIDQKLAILAKEKEKTRKAISDMSKAPPPGLQDEDLKHRYTLRGVATKPSITYVLCPKASGDEDEMLDDDNTPDGMQWWRVEYEVNASGSGAKVTKTKTADYDVLRAVELEHSSALLVYASDRVNDILLENPTLPPALQEFVDRDNDLFAAELQAERNKPPAYNLTDVPRESIERTSMDSTRVEGGGSDIGGVPSPPGYDDVEFMDHPGFGLGPTPIKQGYREDDRGEELDDGPVHEIKLDDEVELEDEGLGTEMVERVHEPLVPGISAGGGDTAMNEDVRMESQGTGVGGATVGEDQGLGR